MKPKRGEPCTGCGLCCSEEICDPGLLVFQSNRTPCPALQEIEGQLRCVLVAVEIASNLTPILQEGLGIGKGCTMDDFDY